jgi:gliding motility-associated-like protein
MQKLLLIGLVLCCFLQAAWATHNLAGEISAKSLGNRKYEITLTTYTDPSVASVDRCYVDIEIWRQNGTKLTTIYNIPRANGSLLTTCSVNNSHEGVNIYQTIKKNIYTATYQFSTNEKYAFRYFDQARRTDIVNIYHAENVNFFVESCVFVTNDTISPNSSPILLNDPIDEACVNQIWTHNPGGFDADGDSLAYKLSPSLQYDSGNGPFSPIPATGYQFPDNPVFGVSQCSMNAQTGLITWDKPPQIGVFSLGYIVEEYKNGILIGYILRDMVIIVKNCLNQPADIQVDTQICVKAKDSLYLPFVISEFDTQDSLYFSLNNGNQGVNGPFSGSSPANIQLTNPVNANVPLGVGNSAKIEGYISWEAPCDFIRSESYQIDLYAHDNFTYFGNANNCMLSTHQVIDIQVIPPPPSNLQADKIAHAIQLSWNPSACNNAVGYNIYRKIGNANFVQDSICCTRKPPAYNYQLIHYQQDWANNTFVDSLKDIPNLYNQRICYLVTALFGNPENPQIESCATNESCISMNVDTLYMTKVSVAQTHSDNGEMELKWTKPRKIDGLFIKPYQYRIFRSNNNQYPATLIAILDSADTTFIDSNLDTETRGYNYRVEVYDSTGEWIYNFANKNVSSSIFLEAKGSAQKVELTWKCFPSWQNQYFRIYRSVNNGTPSILATIPATNATTYYYADAMVSPAPLYCYYISAVGEYAGIDKVEKPLVNLSNRVCAYAQMNIPPCTPPFLVQGNCDMLKHWIRISKLSSNCDDYLSYISIYAKHSLDGPYSLTQNVPFSFASDTVISFDFQQNPDYFPTCYAISATNIYGTTSPITISQCIEYCPSVEFGNVFSPNGDGINEVFSLKLWNNVLLKEIEIYNRWGDLVYKGVANPLNLWDGRDKSGASLHGGVYYYVLHYEEIQFSGNVERYAKGWVMMVR